VQRVCARGDAHGLVVVEAVDLPVLEGERGGGAGGAVTVAWAWELRTTVSSRARRGDAGAVVQTLTLAPAPVAGQVFTPGTLRYLLCAAAAALCASTLR
jgi:hypothetical protein